MAKSQDGTSEKERRAAERAERLARALRENLKRRKDRSRAIREDAAPDKNEQDQPR